MVAELPPFLSDAMPRPARRAGFGDRFHYWRGASGRRYLFSAVPFETLTDFRSVAVILAEGSRDGHFVAFATATIDAAGRLDAGGFWPESAPEDAVTFVHFLAETEVERQEFTEDLFGRSPPAVLNLAA